MSTTTIRPRTVTSTAGAVATPCAHGLRDQNGRHTCLRTGRHQEHIDEYGRRWAAASQSTAHDVARAQMAKPYRYGGSR